MLNNAILLAALLVCHYVADFCLTMPMMIRAKADGRNPRPILLHAAIHAALMGGCLWGFGTRGSLLWILMATELLSHFLIDTLKARLSVWFPFLADTSRKPYWIIYGLDQLLHQLVVAAIWYAAITA